MHAAVTLIRPVVTYGAETWTMTKKEEQAVLVFERKMFRRIYGTKYVNGEWKIRTNRSISATGWCNLGRKKCD
jgi:hypothetical protein